MKLRYKVLVGALVVLGTVAGWGAWTLSHNDECTPPPDLAAGTEAMNAIRFRCFGGPDILKLETVAKPEPGEHEVLVRVTAAGVNPLDWHYMRGEPYIMRLMGAGTGAPADPRLGVDYAGRVEKVGRAVSKFTPGDRVFGVKRGAFGEYVVVSEQGSIVPLPPGLDEERAASVGVAGVTALQALRDVAGIQPGDKVLINGASGGVGTFAVQLARAMGAEVHGVCSTRNVNLVRSLGAARVFDYTQESYLDSAERYDAIIDNVGNHSLLANRRVMKPGATLVIVGGPPGKWLGPLLRPLGAMFINPFVDQNFAFFIANENATELRSLAEYMARGEVTPHIGHRYPLAHVPDAIRLSESGRARGKIVINVE